MKFVLNEVKLWFNNSSSKSYEFKPNKINVITGDSDTGKTSFWSIIDYCLLSTKINIANTISEKVSWYGINFTINNKEISIIRKSPYKNTPSDEICFYQNKFPINFTSNKKISEVKSILDKEFGITDVLRFPLGEDSGSVSFNISYRYFLLFNSLTENIIGDSDTFFDTAFYGKDEFEPALKKIYQLVIGVDGMRLIKSEERIKIVKKLIKNIKTKYTKGETKFNEFKNEVFKIVTLCETYNFIEPNIHFETVDDAIDRIKLVVEKTKNEVKKTHKFKEIDGYSKKILEIRKRINEISDYNKELKTYKNSLKKSSDSLEPIEFLKTKLANQLIQSNETNSFIELLSDSLTKMKKGLETVNPPIEVKGDVNELKKELKIFTKEFERLRGIQKTNSKEAQKYVDFGVVKYAFEELPKKPNLVPIDIDKLNELNDEKIDLERIPNENISIKQNLRDNLNLSIQNNFDLLTTISYADFNTKFDENDMSLKLYPPHELFPLSNVGSKSNYMFLHLCLFLGFHEHVINEHQVHLPQFLFIDQPSIPYYGTKKNDDESKLIDAFKLLDSFIERIVTKKKNNFQILMVEHAPKEYWENNNLANFHLVDEFVDGKGLIPNSVYNSKG